MKDIRINHPGDGVWIMKRCSEDGRGLFHEGVDQCIAVHEDDEMRGGVVFTAYLGGAIALHMAGEGDNWGTRDFVAMVFDYAFNQLKVKKVVGLVASNNYRALAINYKLGFRLEALITEVFTDGADLHILTMTRAECRWLGVKLKHYRSNREAA